MIKRHILYTLLPPSTPSGDPLMMCPPRNLQACAIYPFKHNSVIKYILQLASLVPGSADKWAHRIAEILQQSVNARIYI